MVAAEFLEKDSIPLIDDVLTVWKELIHSRQGKGSGLKFLKPTEAGREKQATMAVLLPHSTFHNTTQHNNPSFFQFIQLITHSIINGSP